MSSGVSWREQQLPFSSIYSEDLLSVASSADGTKLVAVVGNDYIYTSTDSGAHWTQAGMSNNWTSVASSTDGSKLVALTSAGGIYTSTNFGVTWPKPGGGTVGGGGAGGGRRLPLF